QLGTACVASIEKEMESTLHPRPLNCVVVAKLRIELESTRVSRSVLYRGKLPRSAFSAPMGLNDRPQHNGASHSVALG
ncbi:MAG: hypothetical protein ACI8TX_003657, partial [Hyphomicrobiaceae bacterium]